MKLADLITRIEYVGPLGPDIVSLRALHRAFMLAVPFENLDIHLGRPIVLDEEKFFDKIVRQRRGGFCYELNGLFAAMLRQIGFDVTLLSAQVYDADGNPGRDFVHLLLLVKLGARWIADVGFGENFSEPLCLDDPATQQVDGMSYQISPQADRLVVRHRATSGEWKPRYSFLLTPRRLTEFAEMCHGLQTNPQSWFRQRRFCTRLTSTGRVTLSDNILVVASHDGASEELPVESDAAFTAALREHFGIDYH